MSDQYIRSTHKMFFLDPLGGHTEKKGKRASLVKQKTAIPFYDIYQDAQRTMLNPYELGAHDLVVDYEKSDDPDPVDDSASTVGSALTQYTPQGVNAGFTNFPDFS